MATFNGTTWSFSASDVGPTHFAQLGQGGYRTLSTFANVATIPAICRAWGMAVCFSDTGAVYKLANVSMGGVNNDISSNLNWTLFFGGKGVYDTVTLTNQKSKLINLACSSATLYDALTYISIFPYNASDAQYMVENAITMRYSGATTGVSFDFYVGSPNLVTVAFDVVAGFN